MSDINLKSTIATKLVPLIGLLHRLGEESRAEVSRIATTNPAKLLEHPSLKETAKTYLLIEAAESFVKTFVMESRGTAQQAPASEPAPEPAAAPAPEPAAETKGKSEGKSEGKSKSKSKSKSKTKNKKTATTRPYNRKGNWGGARPNSGRKPRSAEQAAPAAPAEEEKKKPRDYQAEHTRRKNRAAEVAKNSLTTNEDIQRDWAVTISKGGIKW